MKALNSAGCFEFWVCHPIGYTRCVTDEHEMRWKTRITWKQDNSETQNVNRIVKNITYSDIPNINIVQNYEFEDEKIETQQPQIHLYLSVIIGATVSVMCSQTVTVLFLCLLHEKMGVLEVSHCTHTHFPSGFHLHRLKEVTTTKKKSRNDTYFSDLVHACVCGCGLVCVWKSAHLNVCTCSDCVRGSTRPRRDVRWSVTRGRDKLDWRC